MCFVLQGFGPIQVPRWGPIPARPGPILVPSVPSRIGPGRAETDFFQEDVNSEKLTVKKWWILVPIFYGFFGADFFTVYADFWRFIRDINGEKKTSRYWWSFSRLVFHGLPPLDSWPLLRFPTVCCYDLRFFRCLRFHGSSATTAKGAQKTSCGETVVPKGVFWRVHLFFAPLGLSDVLRGNLKGAEKKLGPPAPRAAAARK